MLPPQRVFHPPKGRRRLLNPPMLLPDRFFRRSVPSPPHGIPSVPLPPPAVSFRRSPAASPPLPLILRTRPATPSSLAAPWAAFGVPRTREQLGRLSVTRMHRCLWVPLRLLRRIIPLSMRPPANRNPLPSTFTMERAS